MVVQTPVAGFHISAARIAWVTSLNAAALLPPVTSTSPVGSTVALRFRRANAIEPVHCQVGDGGVQIDDLGRVGGPAAADVEDLPVLVHDRGPVGAAAVAAVARRCVQDPLPEVLR